jgi:hypothetical protein
MKIVVWNCPSNFSAKAHLLHDLSPDLAIIPECGQEDSKALAQEGYSSLWFGTNPKKGLAVFARSPWIIEQLAPATNTWVVPIKVLGPENLTLIAVWACHNTSRSYAGYVDQLYESFRDHDEWFADGPVVIAGDFNSNARFNHAISGNNHSSIVSLLAERGLTSAYHSHSGELQGEELKPTFHMHWNRDKPHHLDYIFIPEEWRSRLISLDVGHVDKWLTHSDHNPVVASFV